MGYYDPNRHDRPEPRSDMRVIVLILAVVAAPLAMAALAELML